MKVFIIHYSAGATIGHALVRATNTEKARGFTKRFILSALSIKHHHDNVKIFNIEEFSQEETWKVID